VVKFFSFIFNFSQIWLNHFMHDANSCYIIKIEKRKKYYMTLTFFKETSE
jgi:hypothetical protein